MTKSNMDILFQLSNLIGIGSDEKYIVSYLEDVLQEKSIMDGLQSAMFTSKKGNHDLHTMVAVHIDEVGFMVENIESDGSLKLQMIGGIWPHILLNQDLVVTTQDNKQIHGVVVSKASHSLTLAEREKVVSNDEIYLDLGVYSDKEVKELGICIGDMVGFDTKAQYMNNADFISGKAFDNRSSVACATWLYEYIRDTDKHWLTLAATSQEEVGLRGARTSAYVLKPDFAIVIDTTVAKSRVNDEVVELGNGVVIGIIDAMTITNRGLLNYVEGLCENHKISHQYGLFTKGGTDAGNIHKSEKGIPTIVLSIPIRYMHTHRSIINRKDLESVFELLKIIVEDLTLDKLNYILEKNYEYKED